MPISPALHDSHAELIVRALAGDECTMGRVLAPLAHLDLSLMSRLTHDRIAEGLAGELSGDISGDEVAIEVLYVPDEEHLAALLLRAPHDGDDGHWFTLRAPAGAPSVDEWAQSGRPFPDEWATPLTDPTDALLVEAWGRALSPRSLLRGALTGDGEAVMAVPIGPGQSVMVMRADRLDAAIADDSPDVFVQLAAPLLDPERLGYVPMLAPVVSYDGEDGWRSWAGPAADTIAAGRAMLVHALDADHAAEAIEAAARRLGVASAAEPDIPEGFPADETLPDSVAGASDFDDTRRWFRTRSDAPFWVRAGDVATLAAGRALTIGDAAAVIVGERAHLAHIGHTVADAVAAKTGDAAYVRDHDRLQVRIGTEGVAQFGMQNLARRMTPDEILAHVLQMHTDSRAYRGERTLDMSARWFALQLRPRDWTDEHFGAEVRLHHRRDIADDADQDKFTLVATLEDEQQLTYLTESVWKTLPEDHRARDVAQLITEDLARVRIDAHVATVADRPPHGPMCVIAGTNIASALADDGLLAGLVAALRARGIALPGSLIAYAPTADLALIGARTDDMTHRLDMGNSEAETRGWRRGLPLRFVRLIDDLPAPVGIFSVDVA